jgi:hypothetical protein
MALDMKTLRAHLRRTSSTIEDAGEAGEELTQRLLDNAMVSWYLVEQSKSNKSKRLIDLGAKRVDFIVALDGMSILLDAKCLTPHAQAKDSVTFALGVDEVDRLNATAKEFGLEAAVIFWDRKAREATYVIDFVRRLSENAFINGKPALAATFPSSEIITINLSR